jgi:enoyl-CoA hydratase
MIAPDSSAVQPIEPSVLFEIRGQLGLITLNRPRAINALTHEMVTRIHRMLDEWAVNDTVQTVALVGAGERGLCAGGDIVSLYEDAKNKRNDVSAAFFRDEYRLNARIDSYAKPYVAVMDGIVLGGGVGLSSHGSHRVVTERSRIGLPETGIGFVPDVGSTWLLSRAPGELGTHLALTSLSVDAADAIAVGLADSYIHSDTVPALLRALEETDATSAIAALSLPVPPSKLLRQQPWIDEAYATNYVCEIERRLKLLSANVEESDAAETLQALRTKSPTALVVTLESLRRAKQLPSLKETLAQEYRVSLRAHRSPDFVEGVRAQVIEKDRKPRWVPGAFDDVSPEYVEEFFASLGDAELDFFDSATSTSKKTT